MTLYRRIENEHLTAGGQYLAGYFEIVDAPILQRVTPEAMAELEGRGAWVILFRHREAQWNRYATATYFPRERCWCGSNGNKIDPLDFCWFIVPDAIPEVQQ